MTEQPETARELLWRHQLPEDVIDGALALFAQELAGKIRARFDGSIIDDVREQDADLISPENWARTEPAGMGPATDRPINDMRELYAVQHAITDAGGTLTPSVHQAIDALRETWDRGLRRVQAAFAEAEPPLSPDYEHPACGFHWHGRDGMDIPMRDGQPVCPRCELAKLPAPADRATVLRELADQQEATATTDVIRKRRSIATARRLFAVELRRMADEAQQPETATDDYERTTGHLITCLAVAGGTPDPDCPCAGQPAVAQQPKEARP